MKHLLLSFLLFTSLAVHSQVGIGTTTPAASAVLDASSTTQGFLPPRMTTTQRGAISSPAAGLIIFNSSSNALEMYTGSKWISMGSSSADPLPSIQIGTQVWQAKNLDVAFYRNGDPIPQVTNANAWYALTTGAWCYINNDSTLGTKFGKLYNWYAVNDARGLAPQGWHVPSDAEWTTLETILGGFSVAGGKMKEAGTLNWTTVNEGGNNNSGLAVLPGGLRDAGGTFITAVLDVVYGFWWSATETTLGAWNRILDNTSTISNKQPADKRGGFSVRCLRD
jgi:uncharacterized protein (TIGR02145 family)